MASAHDVAAYILEKTGEIPALKLQKLVYYSQAWHLVWDDEPLFPERIEAWANGPVCRSLYASHRGLYSVHKIPKRLGMAKNLTKSEKETIDVILENYGSKSGQWLSDQTHMEDPWKDARVGLSDTDRGETEITKEAMAEYYSSL